jgi:hypothetical protein
MASSNGLELSTNYDRLYQLVALIKQIKRRKNHENTKQSASDTWRRSYLA